MKKILATILVVCMFATMFIIPTSAEVVSDDITADVKFLYDIDMEEFGLDIIKTGAQFIGSSSFTNNNTGKDPGGFNLVDNRKPNYTLTDGTEVNKNFSMIWLNDPTTESGVAANDAKLEYTFNVPTAGTYEFVFIVTAERKTEEAQQRGFGYDIDGANKKLVNIDSVISMSYGYTYSYSDMVFTEKGDKNFQPGYVYGITADLTAGEHKVNFYHYEDWAAAGRPNFGGIYVQPYTANTDVIGGKCGDNATWTIQDNTLIIGGTGDMDTYSSENATPWSSRSSTIEQVLVQKDVTSISEYTFKGYTNLKKVVLGNSIAAFPATGFAGCTGLETVLIPGNITGIDENTFKESNLKTLIMKNAGENAFTPAVIKNCTNLENLTVQGEISALSSDMFANCANLKSVNISVAPLTSGLPANFFKGLTKLETVSLKGDIGAIGDSAFEGCTALKNINVVGDVTSIGNKAFKDCTSLEKFEFLVFNKVTSIGESAFEGCTALKDAKPTASVTTIGANAFKGCTAMTKVELKKELTSIGAGAFEGCTAITDFKFGGETSAWQALVADKNVVAESVTINCSNGDITPAGVVVDTTTPPTTTVPPTTNAPATTTQKPDDSSGCSCGKSSVFITIAAFVSAVGVIVFTKKKF